MKKLFTIIVLVLSLLCLPLFGGCSYMAGDNTGKSSESGESDTDFDTEKSGFDDFKKYLEDGGFVKGDGQKVTASLIGAAYGERYSMAVSGSRLYVELYVYTDTKSAIAKRTIKNAKTDGTFSLYNDMNTESTVAAVSKDGKFLMLYTDSTASGSNVQKRNEAVDAVKNYKK